MVTMEWQVYADDSRSVCLAQGIFPVQWVEGDDAEVYVGPVGVRLSTLHPQLVPEIELEAKKLLASVPHGDNESSFSVKASVVGLQPASDNSGGESLFCVLKTHDVSSQPPTQETALYQSWLDAKLHRAEFHRQRGNDHFKRDTMVGAVRSYEAALQWLACPASQCEFSALERDRVHTIAIPCHTNLATCHWKRHDMDACITHATNALALDPAHGKARYRRSQAYLRTKQFDEAIADLELVVAAEPESKLFSSSLVTAKLARQQHRAKQKQALASAFHGD